MTMQTFALNAGRLNKFKGQILAHAVPQECLSKAGRSVPMPKNNSDTYVARRFLPYGGTSGTITATSDTQNRFFGTGTTDRTNTLLQANQVQEGVTPTPESVTPVDVSVVLQQYGCLYGYSDKVFDLYEDDIPKEMIKQTGERVTLVNESVIFGALKASTNQYYGGTGTTRATVDGGISLNMLRKMARALMASHGKMVTNVLKAGPNYATEAVSAGFLVYCHTDLEPDIRDLAGFIPIEKYASGTAMANEVGKVERFRFITSPEFPSILDAGAATGATGLLSAGTKVDVYQFIVLAADAFSQIAVRGLDALDPTHLPPGTKDKSDPLGQRGYIGTSWWKAALIENDGWMAVGNVGAKSLA